MAGRVRGSNVLGGVFEELVNFLEVVGFDAVDHVVGNVSELTNVASLLNFLPQWEEPKSPKA